MSPGDEPGGRLERNVGATVSVALIVVGLAQGSADALVAALQSGKLKADAADYVEFANLYLSTFLLSATITGVVAAVILPPLFGSEASWQLPLLILVGGAIATGLPVTPNGGGPLGIAFAAFTTFAAAYGLAFMGGLIVGAAGGVILYFVAEYLQGQ